MIKWVIFSDIMKLDTGTKIYWLVWNSHGAVWQSGPIRYLHPYLKTVKHMLISLILGRCSIYIKRFASAAWRCFVLDFNVAKTQPAFCGTCQCNSASASAAFCHFVYYIFCLIKLCNHIPTVISYKLRPRSNLLFSIVQILRTTPKSMRSCGIVSKEQRWEKTKRNRMI